ncbi:MAG TPA: hypothetical protein VLB27_01565 [candidate division Zixibacteria bacterium]|nr:hypothetical protein [candidate division Zixibacteria bacterium]
MSWKRDKERDRQDKHERENAGGKRGATDKPRENAEKRTPLELYRESGFDSGFVFHEE